MNGFATSKYVYILDITLLLLLFLALQAMWDIFLCAMRTQDNCILQFPKAYLSAVLILTKLVNWQHVKRMQKNINICIF